MTIENDFLDKMSKTNLDNINSMDFVLNLDLLNGCTHSCEGCFINKVKVVDEIDDPLKKAYTIAQSLADKGLRFRELILGPTDFFSAKNTIDVLENTYFQKLLKIHPKTRITAACIFDNLDQDHFKKIFNILDDEQNYRKDMILEFLIPLNSKKAISQDAQYIKDNKWALEFFAQESPKVIDWSYVINIHNNEPLKENYSQVVEFIKNEFNTILEFNPGFFRSNNRKVVDKHLSYWKSFLQDVLSSNDPREVFVANLDKHHNTENTICLNLHNDKLYFSPFIYEQVVDYNQNFEVLDHSAEAILSQHQDLQIKGFHYAQQTNSCSDCQFLSSCVGRNILNFMENKDIKSCLFPDMFKQIDVHNNIRRQA